MLLEVLAGSFDYYSWIILPLLIFISRVCDVTLGTLRHVFISKGYKTIVPFLGFFEVLIWLIVVAQIMKKIENWACYIGWASGFATGTYVGLLIEEKLALGMQIVRIITNQDCDQLITDLKAGNHGLTIIDGQGAKGPVKILFTIVKRTEMRALVDIIHKDNPNAFYTIEDIKDKEQGVFTKSQSSVIKRLFAVRK